jgi:Protein of unknown function (DUF3089)
MTGGIERERLLGRAPARSTGARRPHARTAAAAAALALAALALSSATASAGGASAGSTTVWLCRPGLADDPCRSSLAATVVTASGSASTVAARPAANPRFDCFYVYPTVSREPAANADLRIQKTEIAAAEAQASRFSEACRVYAPIYRQVTLAGLAAHPNLDLPTVDEEIAYNSLLSGFRDYLAHYNDGRPIVFIGHSQGAALLIELLARVVDEDASLRHRLVLAIILGGDVEVRDGSLTGGSFAHIPLCSQSGEHGCVIAYSSFPGEPPAASLFGRPGQGVALQSDQTGAKGLEVACVNPAALAGGTAALDPFFPSEGAAPTPWVEFPGLYTARCETASGATWLQVTKISGASDRRPLVTEQDGPDWGYHIDDVNLALGNLVADAVSAEKSWLAADKTA